MKAIDLKIGNVVRPPWREYGDDKSLTGVVIRRDHRMTWVRWNGDGDTTEDGSESGFAADVEIDLVCCRACSAKLNADGTCSLQELPEHDGLDA